MAFWSHGGADGPIGEGITSGEYNLMNYTGSILDQNQLSLAGWERINWNFDSDNSLIAFYGCQTAGFAERLLEVLKDVTHTAGQGAQVGPSYSTGKFESVSFWYSLFPTTKSVYYGSSVNGNFEGVTLFEKGKLDNSNILKGNASLR